MIPISIRFKCFGPYMDEQFVDFEKIKQQGIFLICGETGSGKTTILDAICYALYAKSSGSLRRDMTEMRCKYATTEDSTLVEYTFRLDKDIYRFTRELRYGTKKLNSFSNCCRLIDGVWIPLMENPKDTFVSRKAEELLGLTYEQFRQVVILPQGQFEKLLVSDSSEKEAILSSIFHVEKWARITGEIKRRTEENMKQLEEKKNAVQSKLETKNCASLQELREKITENNSRLEELSVLLEDADNKRNEATRNYEKALEENKDFEVLDELNIKLAQLMSESTKYSQLKSTLKLADAAEGIMPLYKDFDNIRKQLQTGETNTQSLRRQQEGLEKEYAQVIMTRDEHKKQAEDFALLQEKFHRMKDAVHIYEEIDKKENAVKEISSKVRRKKAEYEKAKLVAEKSLKDWETAREKGQKANAQLLEANTLYNDNIAGILAKTLKEGCPCPVCGSVSHPGKAKYHSENEISREVINELNEVVLRTAKEIQDANNAYNRAENERIILDEELRNLQTGEKALEAEYQAARAYIIDGIGNISELNREMISIQNAIRKYEEEGTAITESLTRLQVDLNTAKNEEKKYAAQNEILLQEYRKTEAQWNTECVNNGIPDEETFLSVRMDRGLLEENKARLHRYEQSLADTKENIKIKSVGLESRMRPQTEVFLAEKKSCEEVYICRRDEISVLKNTNSDMIRLYEMLKKTSEAYEIEYRRAEKDLEFSKILNPRTGISLPRFVLGVMLSTITAAANTLLATVHGGRYRLMRSNEGVKSKAGLELDVLDNENGEIRSVRTLSGGEKFLVALSLSIGLSTVAQTQSGGIMLKAMFVDEGFGSLDGESIDDALSILDGVQKSHGVVGIISHVDKLRESIPVKLEIVKGSRGNHIKI